MKRNYNTFLVIACRSRKIILVTSSARKAAALLQTGNKIEVWNMNQRVETIYAKWREKRPMQPYIEAEREYIGLKQKQKEERNMRKK